MPKKRYAISVTSNGPEREIVLEGYIRTSSASTAMRRLKRINVHDDTKKVVINFRHLELIDGAVVRVLGDLHDRCKERKVPCSVIGAKGQPLTMLQITGRDRDLLPSHNGPTAS